MKSPPKMPQRAMVRIWVASLHQELRYPMGTGVSVLSVLQKGLQGWIRTAAALSQKTAQKQPSGLFLAARLAQSTRAHQKTSTYASALRFLFCNKAKLIERMDSNSIDPPNSPAGKKAPVQQRRTLPAAETGRSCWGCGQQDARAAQGTVQPLGAATRAPYTARLATSARTHIASVPDL